MKVVSKQVLSAASNASVNGSAFDTNQAVNLTFQAICNSVDPAGTVKIQGSNDQPPQGRPSAAFVPTNWSDIPNATSAISSGVGPMIVLSNVACQYMRVVYTRSGGGAADKTIVVRVNAVGA